ncbi:MAG: protease modulator HflC [Limimaricola sp.]|uniref:protease modulator HflC n=1 Tax=Limimaricola sp. TaxID=2211665 RepID=UPI001D1A6977|nr:protease modulator HflC [Limimaricola sp.]MBI1416553.1 protease modulator HflC [Limimaricola sp.]
MRLWTILGGTAALLLFLALNAIYIVDPRQKVLVLQFGEIVSVKEDPGLGFKIPLIQEVVRYDSRILSREMDSLEVTPSDDRRLVVDAFARYRIADVRKFRQAVGTGGQDFAASRLDGILRAKTRDILGSVSSNDILSTDRAALMLRIRNAAIPEAEALGLQVIDVRLKRTDLPPANLNATYERMKAEREREAADEIARGNEAAQRVRAQADRTVVELVSDAKRQAEIARGEADAQRAAIFAKAYGADPEFFAFYRSMTAYGDALKGGNTAMVLGPNSEFFNYLNSDTGIAGPIDGMPAPPPAPSAAAADAVPADAAPAPATAPATPPAPATAPAPAPAPAN